MGVTIQSTRIDYIWIGNSGNITAARPRFITLSQFLQETKKPIMISIDNEGMQGVANWGATVANTWRTLSDFKASWGTLLSAIDKQTGFERYSGEGAWNYPSSLKTELPLNEFTVNYMMWIALKSPLVLDLANSTLTKEQINLLLNDQLLQIHQDSLKKQARLMRSEIYQGGKQEVWGTTLSKNRLLLVFINGLAKTDSMEINLRSEAGLDDFSGYWLRDPISRQTIGSSSNVVLRVTKVEAHGVVARIVNF